MENFRLLIDKFKLIFGGFQQTQTGAPEVTVHQLFTQPFDTITTITPDNYLITTITFIATITRLTLGSPLARKHATNFTRIITIRSVPKSLSMFS